MPEPTLLMIRPLPQAQEFVQALMDHTGQTPAVIYAPVLQINPVPFDPIPETAQFLLFSSVNGVNYYADQVKSRQIPALCVGDTTAAAAQDAGFTAQSAGGTAADLIELAAKIADPAAGPLVYVCGAMIAHNIDAELASLGFQTARCTVYEQHPCGLTPEAIKSLQNQVIIPVSSPNTAAIFADQTANIDLSAATFVCISENARAPLAQTNAHQIIASAPTRAAMITAISGLL